MSCFKYFYFFIFIFLFSGTQKYFYAVPDNLFFFLFNSNLSLSFSFFFLLSLTGTLRVGVSLDKCTDMGPLVDERQYNDVMHHINRAKEEGSIVYQAITEEQLPKRADGSKGLWIPPTLITNCNSTSTAVQEEIFGPVLVAQSFRTAKEGIKLANNTRYGLGASVWTEKMNMALEVALSIKAGTVWINGHNMFDAASGFGGYRESGFGRDGGKEGLYEYVKPIWMERPRPVLVQPEVTRGAEEGGGGWSVKIPNFGSTTPARPVLPRSVGTSSGSGGKGKKKSSSSSSSAPIAGGGPVTVVPSPINFHMLRDVDEDGDDDVESATRSMVVSGGMPKIDRTPKVFYGGKQVRFCTSSLFFCYFFSLLLPSSHTHTTHNKNLYFYIILFSSPALF